MQKDNLRTITTSAGIGDSIWLFQKLINSGERFHFKIPDGKPQRGKQIFDLLPQIAESCKYTPGLNYKKINNANIQNKKKNWSQINEQSFVLSANRHLEGALRIEKFLPDLKTSFRLEYATTDNDREMAYQLLFEKLPYIGIYCSAYGNAQSWGAWLEEDWFKFIRLLYHANRNFVFVIIGAPYDLDLSQKLMDKLTGFNIPYINTIGQPLSVVIEILKRLTYFVGFPSGLSILNETLGKDGIMFYSEKVKKIINTWADPERIANGNIKECLFCEPEKMFDWVKYEYKLFDRL